MNLYSFLEKAKEEYGDVEVVKYGYNYNNVQYAGLVEHANERCRQVEIY